MYAWWMEELESKVIGQILDRCQWTDVVSHITCFPTDVSERDLTRASEAKFGYLHVLLANVGIEPKTFALLARS